MKKLTLAGLLATAILVLFGCKQAENAVNCHDICDMYKTCLDDSYDTGACESKCRNDADADKDYSHKANVCEACLDDMSCAGATFSCSDDCIGIVP